MLHLSHGQTSQHAWSVIKCELLRFGTEKKYELLSLCSRYIGIPPSSFTPTGCLARCYGRIGRHSRRQGWRFEKVQSYTNACSIHMLMRRRHHLVMLICRPAYCAWPLNSPYHLQGRRLQLMADLVTEPGERIGHLVSYSPLLLRQMRQSSCLIVVFDGQTRCSNPGPACCSRLTLNCRRVLPNLSPLLIRRHNHKSNI